MADLLGTILGDGGGKVKKVKSPKVKTTKPKKVGVKKVKKPKSPSLANFITNRNKSLNTY